MLLSILTFAGRRAWFSCLRSSLAQFVFGKVIICLYSLVWRIYLHLSFSGYPLCVLMMRESSVKCPYHSQFSFSFFPLHILKVMFIFVMMCFPFQAGKLDGSITGLKKRSTTERFQVWLVACWHGSQRSWFGFLLFLYLISLLCYAIFIVLGCDIMWSSASRGGCLRFSRCLFGFLLWSLYSWVEISPVRSADWPYLFCLSVMFCPSC